MTIFIWFTDVPYIKTVQELEADMKPTTTPGGHNYPQQPIPHPLAMNHHKIERQNRMTPPGARMTPPGVRMTPPTVIHHHQPHQQQHQQHQQPSSQQSSRRSSEDEGDLTAFNKLLSLMQAGAAAAVESPKIPVSFCYIVMSKFNTLPQRKSFSTMFH